MFSPRVPVHTFDVQAVKKRWLRRGLIFGYESAQVGRGASACTDGRARAAISRTAARGSAAPAVGLRGQGSGVGNQGFRG